MAAVTAQQVQAAQAAGYAAGYRLDLPSPNPFAPPHVAAWRGPRTPAEVAALDRRNAGAAILARVWRAGYQAGQAAYGRDRGLAAS